MSWINPDDYSFNSFLLLEHFQHFLDNKKCSAYNVQSILHMQNKLYNERGYNMLNSTKGTKSIKENTN